MSNWIDQKPSPDSVEGDFTDTPAETNSVQGNFTDTPAEPNSSEGVFTDIKENDRILTETPEPLLTEDDEYLYIER